MRRAARLARKLWRRHAAIYLAAATRENYREVMEQKLDWFPVPAWASGDLARYWMWMCDHEETGISAKVAAWAIQDIYTPEYVENIVFRNSVFLDLFSGVIGRA